MNIIVLHTSTHSPLDSSSAALARHGVQAMLETVPGAEVRYIDVTKLRIADNLSCYADGKLMCADPEAGRYRCWANKSDPTEQMPVVYNALHWADVVIVTTSVRWGSHTAALQRVIERMNTLENQGSVYKQGFPMRGKKLGVVVTGLNWKTGQVATNLLETLRWWGFATQPGTDSALAWQRSPNVNFEHPDNDMPYVERWAKSAEGKAMIHRWAQAVLTSEMVAID